MPAGRGDKVILVAVPPRLEGQRLKVGMKGVVIGFRIEDQNVLVKFEGKAGPISCTQAEIQGVERA